MAKVRFEATVTHVELGEYKVISGSDRYVVEQRAAKQQKIWNDKWQKVQTKQAKETKKDIATELTEEALDVMQAIENTLQHTLTVDDRIDWDDLKDFSAFPQPHLSKPNRTDVNYMPKIVGLARVIPSRKKQAREDAEALFNADYEKWLKWEAERAQFISDQKERNEAIEQDKKEYQQRKPSAIIAYCEMVLNNSTYPNSFPQQFEIDFNAENGILVVEYQLPSMDDMPTLKEVKYIQSRDELKEVHISDTEKRRLYDSLVYQLTLRTIHELYEADEIEAITAIVFNGWVETINPSTGQTIRPCIVSIQAKREEFLAINLERIDPQACFKSLKGIAGTKLHNLTPVAPVLIIERDDKRFVDSYNVVDTLDESENLAAMDWEDFENLIRELFEKEFSQTDGEVKVTQASRDGGVDAVAFDPDPIRGGKIVIQAKRYTNVVGVSAVRDLYGTVMNEGANKGILITTSDYGPDAYEFIKGKPLTLLTGNNLLHLLEKHGYKAKIDLQEAKRTLFQKNSYKK